MKHHFHLHDIILMTTVLMALITTACGTVIQPPVHQIETGPVQSFDVHVPMPENPSSGVELNLEFLAGELKLAPGNGDDLASGTATFNAVDLQPEVEAVGSSYTLRQGHLEVQGIPKFPDDVKNEWDVRIANTPVSLNIEAGAYTGRFELGELSLEKLAISEVGSDLKTTFSEPNRVEMSSFTYSTGASKTELKGLANANFDQMTLTSKAGDYLLSFDGELQRDANVWIDSGVSNVIILVPAGVNARVSFEGRLSGVTTKGEWTQNGDFYTLSGSGPTITIQVKMGIGSLTLDTV